MQYQNLSLSLQKIIREYPYNENTAIVKQTIMKANEALQAVHQNIAILKANIESLNKFDFSPFEDSEISDITEHLAYVEGLCQTYILLANGGTLDSE